jgi:uncharacterized membrane protein
MSRWLYLALALTILAFASAGYVYLFTYDRLPEQIPVHWDIHGEPDKVVPRNQAWMNFWIMPLVMSGMLGLTFVLPWISPKQFKVEPFRATYDFIMAAVIVLFGYIHLILLMSSFNPHQSLIRFMVAGILFFLALIGNVLGQVRRNFWMGVRTPWTLASEAVWIKTHRLAAWLFVAFGLLGGIACLAGAPLAVVFWGIIVAALIPVIYSLVLYKQLERQGRV